MKYVLFAIAMMNIVPLALWLYLFKGWRRYVVMVMLCILMVFPETALNFLPDPYYRGTSRGIEISLMYILAVSVLLSQFMLKGFRSLAPDWGSRIYLLYTLLCVPSFLTAANRLLSFYELWKMLMIFLVFVSLYYYLCNCDDWHVILWTFALIVAYNFLVIVKQHVVGIFQAHGMFTHQNSLSIFMALLGNVFLAYYLNSRVGTRARLGLLVFLLASASLFRTYSRGAIALYPIGCGITVLMTAWRGKHVMRFMRVAVIGIFGVLGGMVFMVKVVERFERAPAASGNTRIRFAHAAEAMIRDEPLCGVGLNNWGIKINPPYMYDKTKNPLRTYHDGIVETIYLLVAAECGLPAFFALILWFGYYWVTAFRLTRLLAGTSLVFWPIGLLGGLTDAYLHSMLEWVLKQEINFVHLMILFAVLSYLNSQAKRLKAAETAQQSLALTGRGDQ